MNESFPAHNEGRVGTGMVWQAIGSALLIALIGSIAVPLSLWRPLHARTEVFSLFVMLASLPPLALWGLLTGVRLVAHPQWRLLSLVLLIVSPALSTFAAWQWLRIDRLLWDQYHPADPTVSAAVAALLALAVAAASFRIVGSPAKRPLASASIVVVTLALAVGTFNTVHFFPALIEGHHRLGDLKRYRAEDMTGHEAPGFALRSMTGDTVAVTDLRGRVVVVDFWATWCGPCVSALPHLNALSREFERDGVVVLALSVDRDTAKVRPFVDRSQFSLTTLFADAAVDSTYRIEVIPTTFLIDRLGIIRSVFVGFGGESSIAQIRSEIIALRDHD